MNKLKVGVIGLGWMGKNHVRVYSDIESVKLVCVAEVDTKELTKIATSYKLNAYTDYNEMLEKEELDVVSIAVPTTLHKKVTLDVINKGINILVEKPLAANAKDAKELVDAANKRNVKLMVGHIERFNPAIIELKKRLSNSELGKIYKVYVNRLSPTPERVSDIGVVIDLAVHDIDIINYLLGSEIVSINSSIANKINKKHEDLLVAVLKLKNGVIAILNVDWLTPTKVRELIITGEKGMFMVNYLTQDLTFYENFSYNNNLSYAEMMMGITEGNVTKIKIEKKEPLKLELESFIDCILNNANPPVSGLDGLKSIEIAEDILRNSR